MKYFWPAFILLLAVVVLGSCNKSGSADTLPKEIDSLQTKKEIVAFVFKQTDNPGKLTADVTGAIGNDTITVWFSAETNITSLKPSIVYTGKSISPSLLTAQDFSSIVSYTVTAGNGSQRVYKVKVNRYDKDSNTANRILYIGDEEGYLYALDALTGVLLWKKNISYGIRQAPMLYNGVLYVQSLWASFTTLDPASGAVKWQRNFFGGLADTGPIDYGKTIIACGYDNIYALDTATGYVKWRAFPYMGEKSTIAGTPVMANGNVYIDSLYSVMALNPDNGTTRWKTSLGMFTKNKMIVVGDKLYALSERTGYVLNANTGAVILQKPIFSYCNPLVNKGILYVVGVVDEYGKDAYLYALDASDLSLKWKTPVSGMTYSSPALMNGVIYTGSFDHKLYAVDAETGTIKWIFTAENEMRASPTVANGIVYAGSLDHKMYAINAKTGKKVWSYLLPQGVLTGASVVDSFGKAYYPNISGMYTSQ